MSELRLVILLVGLVFIAIVYFFSRRTEKRKREGERALRQRPHMDELPEIHVDEALMGSDGDASRLEGGSMDTLTPEMRTEPGAQRRKAASTERLIISLHVVPISNREFPGTATQAALERAGLRLGRHSIFHHLPGSGAADPLFSAANIVEPGNLERERLVDNTVPGLIFFMVLPGPREGLEAFTKLLGAARQITTALGGKLEDELRGSLTPQRIQQLREQIIEFQAHEGTWSGDGMPRRNSG